MKQLGFTLVLFCWPSRITFDALDKIQKTDKNENESIFVFLCQENALDGTACLIGQ